MTSMDLNGLIRLVFLEKNDVTFGVLIGLTLLVVVLMLIRSVMEEKGVAADGGVAMDPKTINVAIEGALKKALSDKSISAAIADKAPSVDGATETGDTAELKKVLNEREAKIAALMSDLEAVKSQVDAKPKEAGTDNSPELQKKINELQAKLSEYEIIEDDIADLSLFKEENKKLKEELEKLRAGTETAQIQVQAAQAAVAPAPAVDPVQVAQAAVVETKAAVVETPAPVPPPPAVAASESPAPAKPAPEPFQLDASDDVMGEFAKALSGTSAPAVAETPVEKNLVVSKVDATIQDPQAAIDALLASAEPAKTSDGAMTDAFANAVAGTSAVTTPVAESEAGEAESDPFGPVDTDKMLEEVASMKDSGGDAPNVLEEQLDTDRLMAEMGISSAPSGAEPKSGSRTDESPATAEFAIAVATTPPEPVPGATTPAPAAASATPSTPVSTSPAPAPAAVASAQPASAPMSDAPVDDLLAEFKDEDFQANKGKT